MVWQNVSLNEWRSLVRDPIHRHCFDENVLVHKVIKLVVLSLRTAVAKGHLIVVKV